MTDPRTRWREARGEEMVRDGCAGCRFAVNARNVNPGDPDEGYYDCALLKRQGIWGEDPDCTFEDWRRLTDLALIAATLDVVEQVIASITNDPRHTSGERMGAAMVGSTLRTLHQPEAILAQIEEGDRGDLR